MWLWIKKDCLEINSVPYSVNGLTFPAINLVIYTIRYCLNVHVNSDNLPNLVNIP